MIRATRARILLALSLALLAGPALARSFGTMPGKSPRELFPWATFDPAIPTQVEVTGVRPGARPLLHGELMRYLQALAEASPRARMESYAESHEGRRLVVFAVSDEATVSRLDAFRAEHARRVDPRGRDADDDAAALAGAKAVAWMAYGIHGDELSSVDAAAALAYWLVAGEDERARALRRALVVLIDPIENPDGRDRYLAQTAAFAHSTPNPDQEDLSHTGVWPWGRGNHYLFDLNRDWFTLVQPESRRSQVIASWHPQLVLDAHEMGDDDSYLFSPPRRPFNPLLPDYTAGWWERFAADQAAALDRRGYGYYTREWNEEFFPGYGSSWAAYLGAIGILYEMSGTAGTVVRRSDGTLRTYAEAVEHQVASSVANLETLAAGSGELLADFVAGRRAAIVSPRGPARAWLLPPGRVPARTDALARLLIRQGLELRRAAAPVTVPDARDALSGETADRELPAGTWLLPLDQPLSRLASVLLDPHVPMSRGALAEVRDSIERGEGARLYDVTAWSLPLLFGVEAYWTTRVPGTGGSADEWSAELVPESPAGTVEALPTAYGYLLDGGADATMGALAALLQEGISVAVADEPFRVAGRDWGRGALLVRREGNPADLAGRLEPIALAHGVDFHPTPTALAEEGPDLGGRHFHTLAPPRVGVLAGMPVSPSDYGALWYVLDQRLGLRFSALDLALLPLFDLERYDVLVLPPAFGGAESYRRALGEAGAAALVAWIEAGGTAIGVGSGAELLAGEEASIGSTRLRRQALDTFPPPVLGASAQAAAAAAPLRAAGWTGGGEAGDGEAGDGEAGDGEAGDGDGEAPTPSTEVEPLIGPGARPFAPDVGPARLQATPLAEWLAPLLPAGRAEPEADDLARADQRLRAFGPRGTLLAAELDPRHWLAWGLPAEIAVLVSTSSALVAGEEVEVAARFPEPQRLHLGGLLWPEAAGRIAHTAYATRERVGEGQVILFLDHPTFRAWPLDTQRMFANAVLYGPGLGTSRPIPW